MGAGRQGGWLHATPPVGRTNSTPFGRAAGMGQRSGGASSGQRTGRARLSPEGDELEHFNVLDDPELTGLDLSPTFLEEVESYMRP